MGRGIVLLKMLIVAVAVAPLARASIWYVDKDNTSDIEDGTSWSTAFTNIQPAIDVANAGSGGEVWVAEGTYTAPTDPVVTLKENVAVYGGFIGIGTGGLETSRSQRDWESHVTITDGQNARRCVIGAGGSVLDGFTVTKGSASQGGGIYNNNITLTIAHCKFIQNVATLFSNGGGGAMFNNGGSPAVSHCQFIENHASGQYGDGGAIYNYLSAATISGCSFNGNSGLNGGAVINAQSFAILEKCTFDQNSANNGGAVFNHYLGAPIIKECSFNTNLAPNGPDIYNNSSSPTIINSTFQGGDIRNSNASPTFVNCTLVGNSGISTYHSTGEPLPPPPVIKNCLVWGVSESPITGDAAQVSYSDVKGGYAGTGNLSVNPRFWNEDAGDLRLRADSPCINAGTDVGAPSVDIDGNTRPYGTSFDIGAYEYQGPRIAIDPPSTLLTRNGPVTYDVTYSNADSISLGKDHVTLVSPGSATASVSVSDTGGGIWRITLSDITGDGLLGISLEEGTAQDSSGNPSGPAGPSVDFMVDNTRPTVAVNSNSPNPVPTSPIPVTVLFSEAVTGFSQDDILVSNGSIGEFSGSDTSYGFSVTPIGQGLISINIAEGVAVDTAGNENLASNTLNRTYDSVGPTVTLSSSAPQTVNGPITVDVTLGEPSTNFISDGITPTNATVSDFSGSGAAYTFTLTPLAKSGKAKGPFSAVVNAGSCTDPLGNPNTASNTLQRTYSPSDTLAIVSPNGGEKWRIGRNETIQWTSSKSIAAVKIELLRNGQVVSVIKASTDNDGLYKWRVKDSVQVGKGYKVRITDKADSNVSDTSDGAFRIRPPK